VKLEGSRPALIKPLPRGDSGHCPHRVHPQQNIISAYRVACSRRACQAPVEQRSDCGRGGRLFHRAGDGPADVAQADHGLRCRSRPSASGWPRHDGSGAVWALHGRPALGGGPSPRSSSATPTWPRRCRDSASRPTPRTCAAVHSAGPYHTFYPFSNCSPSTRLHHEFAVDAARASAR